jgi:colanic acid/amylovoran biosynthesis glycosyltransferase
MTVICVVSPQRDLYSETFIRAHISHLPAKVWTLYGGYFPTYWDGEVPLLPNRRFLHRAMRSILRRVRKLPSDYFEKLALKDFLLEKKVDVVLAEYGPTGVEIMWTCMEVQIPLIVQFHGYDVYHHDTLQQYGKSYICLFEKAAALIVVSRDMESELQQLGAPQEKIFYNPCCADTSLFQISDPSQAPPLFVAVGRFVDKKAPYLTILAFEKVLSRIPEARLIMLGDGPLLEACRQMTRALGITRAVELPGACPHDQVANTMRKARAFVQHSIQTSYGDSEGTPVVITEAGAAGLPVIGTRHAGIKDVIVDGETGLLVDEGDIDGMAEQMIRLAKDPLLAAKLGKAAHKYVSNNFTMEKSIDNLWVIIKGIIESQRV